jgi:hypothetical protein
MNEDAKHPPADATTVESLLGDLVGSAREISTTTGSWIAEVIDDRHPDLIGRVEVRWRDVDHGRDVSLWVPTTSGLPVRRGDRVMLQQPENWPEPLVVAVIDGYARRSKRELRSTARIELRRDESVEILGHRGAPLLAIHEGESGPVLRILSADMAIDVPGHLRVSAQSLELQATDGSAEIEAEDDVIVRGESIHLN